LHTSLGRGGSGGTRRREIRQKNVQRFRSFKTARGGLKNFNSARLIAAAPVYRGDFRLFFGGLNLSIWRAIFFAKTLEASKWQIIFSANRVGDGAQWADGAVRRNCLTIHVAQRGYGHVKL